jgi:hypothetical protein
MPPALFRHVRQVGVVFGRLLLVEDIVHEVVGSEHRRALLVVIGTTVATRLVVLGVDIAALLHFHVGLQLLEGRVHVELGSSVVARGVAKSQTVLHGGSLQAVVI